MPKKLGQNSTADNAISTREVANSKSLARLPAAELLSFLKQTRRVQTWTAKELANTLKIGSQEAKQAIIVLQLQGYVEPVGSAGKWRITEQGDLVSGSKSPRFTRQSIEQALDALRDRIRAVNDDPKGEYKITDAIAFGDFLTEAARVQAAEVGVRLAPKKNDEFAASAKERRAELVFLKHLRGKTALLHVHPYEEWMRSRSHRDLL